MIRSVGVQMDIGKGLVLARTIVLMSEVVFRRISWISDWAQRRTEHPNIIDQIQIVV